MLDSVLLSMENEKRKSTLKTFKHVCHLHIIQAYLSLYFNILYKNPFGFGFFVSFISECIQCHYYGYCSIVNLFRNLFPNMEHFRKMCAWYASVFVFVSIIPNQIFYFKIIFAVTLMIKIIDYKQRIHMIVQINSIAIIISHFLVRIHCAYCTQLGKNCIQNEILTFALNPWRLQCAFTVYNQPKVYQCQKIKRNQLDQQRKSGFFSSHHIDALMENVTIFLV